MLHVFHAQGIEHRKDNLFLQRNTLLERNVRFLHLDLHYVLPTGGVLWRQVFAVRVVCDSTL